MQQPKNLKRLLQALAKKGLDVNYNDRTYSVRLNDSPDAPTAEILLPEGFPVEAKALKQLANLAQIRHPGGGSVCKCCATPDFHPGDAGVAIGSIVETEGMLIPAAVGSDINCGMRSHVVDLSLEPCENLIYTLKPVQNPIATLNRLLAWREGQAGVGTSIESDSIPYVDVSGRIEDDDASATQPSPVTPPSNNGNLRDL